MEAEQKEEIQDDLLRRKQKSRMTYEEENKEADLLI